MNKEQFIEELQKISINPTPQELSKLEIYCETLIEYNQHTNLTAIKTPDDIYLKHFYDSLTLLKYFKESKAQVLDIGTGAGFPGMVLAVFCPEYHFVLLDANHKKTDFLQYLNSKLQLPNVEIVNCRAEDYVRHHFESFNYVVSRAVADLKILLELSLPALKINGRFLPMKSNISEEIKDIDIYLYTLNGAILMKEEFLLPYENSRRTILEIVHFKKTDTLYPRSYDKILKKPLKKN